MIEYINIPNFGSFKNFVWDDSIRDNVGNIKKFKKLNILYGRNYSGKTTLSRLLRSLQTGVLPEKYEYPSFSVHSNSGTVTQVQLPSPEHHIRVYNNDFVEEHLSFLKDVEGNITPFAIIGSENQTIDKEISEKEKKLGEIEKKTGLRHEHATKYSEFSTAKRAQIIAENALKTKLTNKATQSPTGIKHNSIYKDPNYNTPKIEADIRTIRRKSINLLELDERNLKETLLKEVPLPDIRVKIEFTASIASLHTTTNKLLSKKITPTKPIQELLDDAILQAWVKEGIAYHKDKRQSCGFCGQTLPEDLWIKLDDHFSKESTYLELTLIKHIKVIEKELEFVCSIVTIQGKEFYSVLHSEFERTKAALDLEIEKYKSTLADMIVNLQNRVSDIFSSKTAIEITDNSTEISKKIEVINNLILKNNKKTQSLSKDQQQARTELRLNEIAQFIKDISLTSEEKKIADLHKQTNELKVVADKLQVDIQTAEMEIEGLKTQLKDERKGADKVNEYLNHNFGHEGLCLKAVEDKDSSSFKFQILRGDKPAFNLSEGECSLVAFCYFIAKLEDTDSKGKKLIICIDDPISSLDSNHIFFVFSLIESLIAKPLEDGDGNKILNDQGKPTYFYEQLFISTHSLEFLKYLKKLSRPKNNHEQFLVIGKEDGSTLELMPSYLRNYITEFNYLFGEIYTCHDPNNAVTKYQSFYNFGNNLRKFLEAFLFFKYPFSIYDQQDYNRRINKFFRDEPGTESLVQRLTNEFSHLGGIFDRSVQPIDHAEISKLAKFVLKKIKDNDSAQFECLLESINKQDPFNL